jgi:hypothetical protein
MNSTPPQLSQAAAMARLQGHSGQVTNTYDVSLALKYRPFCLLQVSFTRRYACFRGSPATIAVLTPSLFVYVWLISAFHLASLRRPISCSISGHARSISILLPYSYFRLILSLLKFRLLKYRFLHRFSILLARWHFAGTHRYVSLAIKITNDYDGLMPWYL